LQPPVVREAKRRIGRVAPPQLVVQFQTGDIALCAREESRPAVVVALSSSIVDVSWNRVPQRGMSATGSGRWFR
jgi:hypothetical protein